jgi:hypothetical protein
MAVAMFFMPESPYYLITKGKLDNAEKSLSWLRGSGYDIKPELEELQTTHQEQTATGSVSLQQLVSDVSEEPHSNVKLNGAYILELLSTLWLLFNEGC